VLLAELNVRHTRRHQPTRRVALGDTYLPTSGPGYGPILLGAVVADAAPYLDDLQRDQLGRFVDDARAGALRVPRIALRYRLQTDVHGLDRSRHRIVSEGLGESPSGPAVVLELDVHGRPASQLLGAVMAAAALPATARRLAFRVVDAALTRPRTSMPEGMVVRRLAHGAPGVRPAAPGPVGAASGARRAEPLIDAWRGVPAERRWAMEVLGLRADMPTPRDEVQRRFRRLLRLAHPDHGASRSGAAERIAELREARDLLLGIAARAR